MAYDAIMQMSCWCKRMTIMVNSNSVVNTYANINAVDVDVDDDNYNYHLNC